MKKNSSKTKDEVKMVTSEAAPQAPTEMPNDAPEALPSDTTPQPTPITFDEHHPYWKVINEVIDPEAGIGIADMGIVYDVQQKDGVVDVKMTLTSMGCPAGPDIVTNIDGVLRMQPDVKDVMIEVVWDPMWTPERMKPEIREMLFGGF